MRKLVLSQLLCLYTFFVVAQNNKPVQKQVAAVRTHSKIVIDGDLKDSAWLSATKVHDFVEWRPSFGKPEPEETKTELYLLYDDQAFYIAGFCHERTTD
ncbi:hypothetical protein ACNPMO_15245, partial [Enterococcus faecium]